MSVYKKLVVDLVAKYKIYTFLTEPMSECTLCFVQSCIGDKSYLV